jgi:hypothetical protein
MRAIPGKTSGIPIILNKLFLLLPHHTQPVSNTDIEY